MHGPALHVGLALPQPPSSVPADQPLPWATVASWAQRAEELGFPSIWVDDPCRASPVGLSPVPEAYDPFVVLGALARLTVRVRLGTLVMCTPLRPATLLAKALATLDVVAEGRLVVGLGAGPAPGDQPAWVWERLAEAVEVMRGMWRGDPFSFDGRHHRTDAARCLPRPAQLPGPPIWLGGEEQELLEVVARRADGWHTAGPSTPAEYHRRRQALVAACERVGRDPASVICSVGLEALVGEDDSDLAHRYRMHESGRLGGTSLDEWRRGRLVGTVGQVQGQLAEWEAAGVSTVVLTVPAAGQPASLIGDLEAVAAATLGAS